MSPEHSCGRREFMKVVGAGAVSLASGCAHCAEGATDKPNIILIMADDLGYGDLSCYGNRAFSTPNLDALARGGVRFTDFHANGPVCSPTRAALLTGRYQQRCGIEGVITAKGHRDTGMALAQATFAEVLKGAGYATGLFGKWHLGYRVDFNPTRQGFDEFCGYVSGNVDYHSHIDQTGVEDWWRDCERAREEGYSTDLITEHGIRFIERHKREPFCLYLPHEAPHYPYQGRNDQAGRAPGAPTPTQGRREDKAVAYSEMIAAMDEGVGRIVETVRRLGIEKNTFIFFCSDNGATPVGSNGPLAGHKGSLWEGGHRVPAIACWPGTLAPGMMTSETAMTMDLFPTMAAIAQVALPAGVHLDGVDLLPVLREGVPLRERALFWRYGGCKAVRQGSWKLLVQGKREKCLRGKSGASVSLHNLADDLGERTDLASVQRKRVAALQKALSDWETDVTAGVALRA